MFGPILRLLTGRRPADSPMTCPACGFSDTLRGFAAWEEDGERGLRGKLPSGHIVVACPKCRRELRYDSLSGTCDILSRSASETSLTTHQPLGPSTWPVGTAVNVTLALAEIR